MSLIAKTDNSMREYLERSTGAITSYKHKT